MALPDSANGFETFEPIPETKATMPIKMKRVMSAYSNAVTPSSFRYNLLMKLRITVSLNT